MCSSWTAWISVYFYSERHFLEFAWRSPVLDPMTTLRFIVGDVLGLCNDFPDCSHQKYVREFLKSDEKAK